MSAYIIYVKKNVCSFYSQKVDNIVKWAAILFMLIRWYKIITQLRKSVTRILHSLFMSRRMCALCIACKWPTLGSWQPFCLC